MFKNCHVQKKKKKGWAQNDPTTWKIEDILNSDVLWCTHGCLLRFVWTREIYVNALDA